MSHNHRIAAVALIVCLSVFCPQRSEAAALPDEASTAEAITLAGATQNANEQGTVTRRKRRKKIGPITVPAPKKRMERGVKNHKFIPKGTWTGGVTLSYAELEADNFTFYNALTDWNGDGHSLNISPRIAYFFWDNNCFGAQFIYQRTNVSIDNIKLDLKNDLDISLKNFDYLQQIYSASFFHRFYVGLGENSRWGLFNETRLSLGGGDGYTTNNKEVYKKTYQDIFDLQLGIKPGITVFITEKAAFEVSLDVLGLKYRKIWQEDQDGHKASHSVSAADFKINVFNISLGLSVFM